MKTLSMTTMVIEFGTKWTANGNGTRRINIVSPSRKPYRRSSRRGRLRKPVSHTYFGLQYGNLRRRDTSGLVDQRWINGVEREHAIMVGHQEGHSRAEAKLNGLRQ